MGQYTPFVERSVCALSVISSLSSVAIPPGCRSLSDIVHIAAHAWRMPGIRCCRAIAKMRCMQHTHDDDLLRLGKRQEFGR
jgi:hypothetical protein